MIGTLENETHEQLWFVESLQVIENGDGIWSIIGIEKDESAAIRIAQSRSNIRHYKTRVLCYSFGQVAGTFSE